ncbi:hypothetical protein [Bacillus sp. T33-2]|uniref:hypothetical protein n=1 Tax=Bacillus sp. T33-2 TaxID=2054168 RepID=UPI0015E0CA68|nr:hypothetical protein [Bacillus sp. T33-2]
MTDEQKKQILTYYQDCSNAYKKHTELKDKSMMDINSGAMQAIRKTLCILNESIEGINA